MVDMSRPKGKIKVCLKCIWCRKPNFERGHYRDDGLCVECIRTDDGKILVPNKWINDNRNWIAKDELIV